MKYVSIELFECVLTVAGIAAQIQIVFFLVFFCRWQPQCCLSVVCSAAASSSQSTPVSVSTTVRSQPPKEQSEIQLELKFSYELQQGYRILRELTSDSNKSFVAPFLIPLDPSSPDYAEYHRRVKRPVWLKQSKLLRLTFKIFILWICRMVARPLYEHWGP